MDVRPIKNDADHAAALREVERLWDAAPGTAEGDRLDVLSTLIDAYEREHVRIDAPRPVDAIRFRMEQQGLRPGDLVPFIGHRGRVSEVLSGKRPLTLKMIQRLHEELSIPADLLIGSSRPRARRARTRTTGPRRRVATGGRARATSKRR